MSIEVKERRIGPHVYRVSQFGTKAGLALLVRLTKILGPGVGSFVHGLGRSDSVAIDSAIAFGIGESLHDLAGRLNEAEVAKVMHEFAGQTVLVVSDEVQMRLSDLYDDHFAGRYDLLLEWARFCMEVNYSCFFAGASASAVLARMWKVLSALQSPTPSTGTSTASPPVSATPTA